MIKYIVRCALFSFSFSFLRFKRIQALWNVAQKRRYVPLRTDIYRERVLISKVQLLSEKKHKFRSSSQDGRKSRSRNGTGSGQIDERETSRGWLQIMCECLQSVPVLRLWWGQYNRYYIVDTRTKSVPLMDCFLLGSPYLSQWYRGLLLFVVIAINKSSSIRRI